jgi:hypothetical protein
MQKFFVEDNRKDCVLALWKKGNHTLESGVGALTAEACSSACLTQNTGTCTKNVQVPFDVIL